MPKLQLSTKKHRDTDGVRNLRSQFDRASVTAMTDGLNWYPNARQECYDIGNKYGLPMPVVAAVTAALSPNLRWELNIKYAEDVILIHRFGFDESAFTGTCYRTNVRKALAILDHYNECWQYTPDYWHTYLLHLSPKGPKTQRFYLCIVQIVPKVACCDSHYARTWLGDNAPGTIAVNCAIYPTLEADCINAAVIYGLSPEQFQAICWCARKEELENS